MCKHRIIVLLLTLTIVCAGTHGGSHDTMARQIAAEEDDVGLDSLLSLPQQKHTRKQRAQALIKAVQEIAEAGYDDVEEALHSNESTEVMSADSSDDSSSTAQKTPKRQQRKAAKAQISRRSKQLIDDMLAAAGEDASISAITRKLDTVKRQRPGVNAAKLSHSIRTRLANVRRHGSSLHDTLMATVQVLEEAQHVMLSSEASAASVTVPPSEADPCSTGKISQIKCWLDVDGYVTGLAFETEAGITAPALCKAEAQQLTDGGILGADESVVKVVSCRGPTGGVSYLEFHTDKKQGPVVTCGQGALVRSNKHNASLHTASVLEEVCASLDMGTVDQGHQQTTALQAYPLAGLQASCNTAQQLSTFTNKCWGSQSAAVDQHAQDPILLKLHLKYDDGHTSRADHSAKAVACDATLCDDQQKAASELESVINGLVKHWHIKQDVWTQHTITSCQACDKGSSSTMTVALSVHIPDESGREKEKALRKIQSDLDTNLCHVTAIHGGCQDLGLKRLKLNTAD